MASPQMVASSMLKTIVVLAVCAAAALGDHGVEAKSKKFNMQFYMHDLVYLKNPENATTVLVAGPNNNVTAINQFGSVMIIDDRLTEGPSRNSTLVGRAQGMYFTDSMSTFSFFLSFTAVFQNKHNGSTISFQGQDPAFNPVREIAVVGGTGDFRSVTGFAQIRTYKVALPDRSVILSFEVFLKQEPW